MRTHRMTSVLLAGTLLLTATPFLPAQSSPKAIRVSTSQNASDFTRTSLDGKTIRLSNYHGKLVLLNFWATWCGPCLAEMPRFSSWQTKYASQGLQVLGVSMDDDAAPVQRTYRKYQITYPVIMGDEHLGELYGGVLGLPISFLISPQGKILARYQGETDLNQLEGHIKGLLPNKNP